MRAILPFVLAGCVAPDLALDPDAAPPAGDIEGRAELVAGIHRQGAWHLTVLLTDDDGLPIEARSGAFGGSAEGADVAISAAPLRERPEEPWLSLAVVIDEGIAARALTALRFALGELAQPYEVEVIRVAGEVAVVAPFGDPDPVDAAATAARGDGRRLLDGIARAADDLARRETPLRLVWVATGGPDEGSETPLAGARAALVAARAGVWASGSRGADPATLAAWSDLYLYDPAAPPLGAPHLRLARHIPALWRVRAVAPRDAVLDLRITTEDGTIELAVPTDG